MQCKVVKRFIKADRRSYRVVVITGDVFEDEVEMFEDGGYIDDDDDDDIQDDVDDVVDVIDFCEEQFEDERRVAVRARVFVKEQ